MPGPEPPPSALPDLPREWRIPPWQPAALLLVVAGLAALDIYGHPGSTWFAVTAVLALALLAGAVAAVRYLLVADDDGIWVRGLTSEQCVRWAEYREVDVVHGRRSPSTLRIYRRDGTFLDVPPSLLQPTLPTKVDKAVAQVRLVAATLDSLASARR